MLSSAPSNHGPPVFRDRRVQHGVMRSHTSMHCGPGVLGQVLADISRGVILQLRICVQRVRQKAEPLTNSRSRWKVRRRRRQAAAPVGEELQNRAARQTTTSIDDVAAQVIHFCRASTITGKSIVIDCGMRFQ
ncbi:MAG: hypothetical protein AAGF51_13510 [Pseudomonadota bacterium]